VDDQANRGLPLNAIAVRGRARGPAAARVGQSGNWSAGSLRGHDAVQDRLTVTSQAFRARRGQTASRSLRSPRDQQQHPRGDEQPHPDGGRLPTVEVGSPRSRRRERRSEEHGRLQDERCVPAQLARMELADVAPVEARAPLVGYVHTPRVVHSGDLTKGEGAQRCRVETHTDGWLPADRRQERLVQWRTSRDISRQSLP